MNKEVMILIELQTLLFKLEFKFCFDFYIFSCNFKKGKKYSNLSIPND